jgi:hypothetical protein
MFAILEITNYTGQVEFRMKYFQRVPYEIYASPVFYESIRLWTTHIYLLIQPKPVFKEYLRREDTVHYKMHIVQVGWHNAKKMCAVGRAYALASDVAAGE